MVQWLEGNMPFPALSDALGPSSGAPGLLAASATVSVARLLAAYRRGIFPWYSDGRPVLWWSPDPRMALATRDFKVSPSLRKTLRRVTSDDAFEIRVDADFGAVMHACATSPRPGQDGTWITPAIVSAYSGLHRLGYAHSIETWFEGVRVGGLYGVSMGRMFFGESMFARRTDASKIALAALVAHLRRQQVEMIDCQQNTAHLASLGARELPRDDFVRHLRSVVDASPVEWLFDKTVLQDLIEPAGTRDRARRPG